jgi:hypothetical protein
MKTEKEKGLTLEERMNQPLVATFKKSSKDKKTNNNNNGEKEL